MNVKGEIDLHIRTNRTLHLLILVILFRFSLNVFFMLALLGVAGRWFRAPVVRFHPFLDYFVGFFFGHPRVAVKP